MAASVSDSLFISRRSLLCAGCGSLIAAGVRANSDAQVPAEGCTVGDDELRVLRSTWSPADMLDRLIPVSGDKHFDRALGRQLVRLARTFGVRPSFAYADDLGGMNAVASPVSLVRGTQGAVVSACECCATFFRSVMAGTWRLPDFYNDWVTGEPRPSGSGQSK